MMASSALVKMAAARKPTGGEVTSEITTFQNSPQWMPWKPPAPAAAAPAKPPTMAWVELLGRPKYQVIRFQVMAPSNAARRSTSPGRPETSLAMVLETFAWKKATVTIAPARLSTAATRTAWRGLRARVEIDVAIAFAVSWKPLVKSKPTAASRTTTSSRSGILDRDRFEQVGDVLALVESRLEQVVDVLPLDQVDRAPAVGEEVG